MPCRIWRAWHLQQRLPPLKNPAHRRSSTSAFTIRRSNSMERPIVHFAFAVFTNATPAPGAREFAQNRQCVSEEDEIHASDVSKRTRMRSKQRFCSWINDLYEREAVLKFRAVPLRPCFRGVSPQLVQDHKVAEGPEHTQTKF
jgi:hypothetical protein